MKKIILILTALLLVGMMSYSQESANDKVPPAVKQAFEKKFPGAMEVSYQAEKKNYKIRFKDKDVQMSALFTSTARWMETVTMISETDIPKKVMKSINKNFKGYTMSDISSVETPTIKQCYQMNLNNEKQGYEVRFSPKGDVLRKAVLKKVKPENPGSPK